MKRFFNGSWAMAVWMLLGVSVAGAVPAGFNVQGRLTDSNGVNRNGSYAIKVSIYDALVNGNLQWTETFPAINVVNGGFQTMLADTTGQPPLVTVFGSGDIRFLEFDVLSGPGISSPEPPMVPRQQLISVPYALRAGSVDAGFGGMFVTGGSPTGTCAWPNPAVGGCGCPAGYNDSYYQFYQPSCINCGWSAGYTVLVPGYGGWNYMHQCWK